VWGPERRTPFRERLRQEDPSITPAEAAELEAWSNRAVDEATSLAELIHHECPPNAVPGQTEVWRRSLRQLIENYGGIDEGQASRLLNQGMYFAIK
jgi:hypothetical protein